MFTRNSILVVVLLVVLAAPILAAGGTVNYSVSKPMSVAGSEIQAGEYEVKWESKDTEATVAFKLKGKVVATVQGKIENLPKKSDYNSLVVGKDGSGRDAIKALLLSDKNFRIAFE